MKHALAKTRRAWRPSLGIGLIAVCIFGLAGHAAEAAVEPDTGPSLATLADEFPLEQLGEIPIESVSTASRFVQRISEAPASVSVITSDDFKHYGYRTLAEALRSVPGLYVTYDRSYSYLGVRGFNRPGDYNSRVLVLVDGHRQNDNVFEGAYMGREFILDPDLIERVEVVRGPGSALYGSSALFGVINVITRRPADVRHAEVSVEAGSFESYKGRFSYGGVSTNHDVQVMVSGSFYQSEGPAQLYFPEFDTPDNEVNHGVADHMDQEQAHNLYASVAWRSLTLSGAFVSRDKEIPTASWETLFNDPRYHAVDDHGYVDLKLDHAFSESTKLMARAYYDDVRYAANYPYFPFVDVEDQGLNRDESYGQMIGAEAQLSQQWHAHMLTFGAEWRDHLRQDVLNFDVAPYQSLQDEEHTGMDGGVYGQGEFAIRTNLLASAGVRFDYYDSFGGTANPRLGLIYSPWTPTNFKLLYGTAYRAPNIYERYLQLGDLSPNSSLDPETIRTYELVWEQKLPADLQLTLSGYVYQMDDVISLDPDALIFENGGAAEAAGIESELNWKGPAGLRARASYALQHAVWEDTDSSLANSPQHLAKLNVLVPILPERLLTGVEFQYTSTADTIPGRTKDHADDFWLVNLTLFSARLVHGLEISGSVYNLFDMDYAYPGGPAHLQDVIYQDGRTFRIKLSYHF